MVTGSLTNEKFQKSDPVKVWRVGGC